MGALINERNKSLAEAALYLGAAFALVSITVLVTETFHNVPYISRFGALATLSAILIAIAIWLKADDPILERLRSVLFLAASLSTTVAVALGVHADGAPALPFLAGTAVSLIAFLKFQHPFLHIGAFGFLFITGFMTIGALTSIEPGDSFIYPLWWIGLGSLWIFFAHKNYLQDSLGYFLASGSIFFGLEFLCFSQLQKYSDRGALIGLLLAGIALISGAIVLIRRSR